MRSYKEFNVGQTVIGTLENGRTFKGTVIYIYTKVGYSNVIVDIRRHDGKPGGGRTHNHKPTWTCWVYSNGIRVHDTGKSYSLKPVYKIYTYKNQEYC